MQKQSGSNGFFSKDVFSPWENPDNYLMTQEIFDQNQKIQQLYCYKTLSCVVQRAPSNHTQSKQLCRNSTNLVKFQGRSRQEQNSERISCRNMTVSRRCQKYLIRNGYDNDEKIFFSSKVVSLKPKVVKMYDSSPIKLKKSPNKLSNSTFYSDTNQKDYIKKRPLLSQSRIKHQKEANILGLKQMNSIFKSQEMDQNFVVKRNLLRVGKSRKLSLLLK